MPSGPQAQRQVKSLERAARSHWDFPRGMAGLALLVSFAEDRGIPPRTLLAGTGVTLAALADPDAVVPARDELTALRNLVRALPDEPLLGLELGGRYHVTAFGILGYALMSSRTVRDAMVMTLRYLDLSHLFTSPQVEVTATEVVIRLETVDLPEELTRFLVERDLAAIHTVLAELVPGGIPFTEVRLAFPGPRPGRAYARLLGVAPELGTERTEVRFAVRHLDRPLRQGNPHTQAVAERMCRDVVARRRTRSGITEQVRVWITRNVAFGADMARAAAELSVSERTLRRRLSAEGTGFQALMDEVRQALAEEMLATEVLSVEDVALRLGYAEASSFIHAFRRWKGMTPAQYQRRRVRA